MRRTAEGGQAATGWPGQRRPIRPRAASLPSSSRISGRCRAAGEQHACASPTRCRFGHDAPIRWHATRQPPCDPTPIARTDVTNALGTCARVGVPPSRWCDRPPRRCVSDSRGYGHTLCGRLPCCSARQARGARVVGRRTVGNAAQLARVRLDAPLGCRGCWSLVAVCAAPPQKLAPYWCTCVAQGAAAELELTAATPPQCSWKLLKKL